MNITAAMQTRRTAPALRRRQPRPATTDPLSILTRSLRRIAQRHGDHVRLPSGRVIATPVARQDQAIFVRAGTAIATDAAGHTLRLGPGDAYGVNELLDGAGSERTVRTEAACDFIVFDRRSFAFLASRSTAFERAARGADVR